MTKTLKLSAALLCMLSSCAFAADKADLWNPKPADGDIVLPMPCGGSMVFRKVVTSYSDDKLDDKSFDAGSAEDYKSVSQGGHKAYVQGAFSDKTNGGKYYLLAKYELTEAQYEILQSYLKGKKCPSVKKFGKEDTRAQGSLSWFTAVDLARAYSLFLLNDKGAQKALQNYSLADGRFYPVVRLPSENEWEFAARGGMAVNSSEFNAEVFKFADSNEPLSDYVWYSGQYSSNVDKASVVGLKKPNPLGFYDILGNVAEIMLEPFRATVNGRLHGQSGGFTVRGGSFLKPQEETTCAYRSERPFFLKGSEDGKENAPRDVGVRFALSLPFFIDREDSQLTNSGEPTVESAQNDANVAALDRIIQEQRAAYEEASKDNDKLRVTVKELSGSLQSLRSNLVKANADKDEMRNNAIRSALRLGGYLCSSIAAEQAAYERTLKNEEVLRRLSLPECRGDAESDKCKAAQESRELKLKSSRELASLSVDFFTSYYADHVNDTLSTFGLSAVNNMLESVLKETAEKPGILGDYIARFAEDLEGYDGGSRNLKKNRERWIKQCSAVKEESSEK